MIKNLLPAVGRSWVARSLKENVLETQISSFIYRSLVSKYEFQLEDEKKNLNSCDNVSAHAFFTPNFA